MSEEQRDLDADMVRPEAASDGAPLLDHPATGAGGAWSRAERRTEPALPREDEERAPAARPPETPNVGKPARASGRLWRRRLLVAAALVLLGSAAYGGWRWWVESSRWETTDDAFITARQFTVSAQITGIVTSVRVTDNEHVPAGATLAFIDNRAYQAALDQAQAQLAVAEASVPNIDAQIAAQKAAVVQAQAQIKDAKAALQFAGEQNRRSQTLAKSGYGSQQQAQQTESQLTQALATLERDQAQVDAANKQLAALGAQLVSARANIAQTRAQGEVAKLNLSYTVIKAAQAGRVVQLTAAAGQLAQPGQALMILVPDPLWVVANFRETQISSMRPGQPVDIHVDAYPNRVFRGHVDSIQPGSGTAFSLLPPENATGNYVKVVQRVPVKIAFDDFDADVVLGPGMSVVPYVRVK